MGGGQQSCVNRTFAASPPSMPSICLASTNPARLLTLKAQAGDHAVVGVMSRQSDYALVCTAAIQLGTGIRPSAGGGADGGRLASPAASNRR